MSIEFALIGKSRRSIYRQFNGQIALADECKCSVRYDKTVRDSGVTFTVTPSLDCPIDEHRQKAINAEQAA